MVRWADLPEYEQDHAVHLSKDSVTLEPSPWVAGPPLAERRVAIVTTAGLIRRGDRPFTKSADDYRIIPEGYDARDLVLSHISINFDRSGFQNDWNVVFPIDRLRELAAEGVIGSVADYHYSFLGSTKPAEMEASARQLAGVLKDDGVNAVLLVPI
jgi:D-proline reductase (dithiol) PrdB